MIWSVFDVNQELARAGRWGALVREQDRAISYLELAALFACGTLAALATACIDPPWRIPGQAIVQSVFPMALGMALVPRRWAGTAMGAGAMLSMAGLRIGGFGGVGSGAMTSLLLTGPMLDAALWGARRGWRLYLRIVLAGMATNLLALGIRWATKLLSGDLSGSRRMASWLPEAIWSYPVCGIVAGIISALAWFSWASRHGAGSGEDQS